MSLFIAAYAPTLRAFVGTWSGRDDYSHGFLVPFISAYLVWMKRDQLRLIAARPSVIWGSLFLAVACGMLFAGTMASVVMAQQASILVLVPALVLLLFGRRMLEEVSFALGYLVLMVPAVTDPLLDKLHWPFQLFGSLGAAVLLEFLGVPVIRNRQFLELPGITLEVANQCSGLRYLISIIALSLPLAHVCLSSRWRRFLLVGSAVAIGILVNPLRIALIAVWVHYRGAGMIHGPSHLFQGFFVSMVGMSFLFLAAWWLARPERREPGTPPAAPAEPARGAGAPAETAAPLAWRAWTIAVVLLAASSGMVHLYRPVAVPPGRGPFDLPLSIGDWRSAGSVRATSPLKLREASAVAERTYRNAQAAEIGLYVGYLDVQEQGRELIYYTQQEVYDRSVEVQIPGSGGMPLTTNLALLPNGDGTLLVLYWYQIGSRQIANGLAAKVATGVRGALLRRTNGAIVVVTRALKDDEPLAVARDEALSFARAAHPATVALFPR